MQENIGRSILGDRKKIILEVVIGVIVALSLIGNAWALWNYVITKTKQAAFTDGWKSSIAQFVQQSEGCKAVDVNIGDTTERFINTKCLTQAGAGAQAATEKKAAR